MTFPDLHEAMLEDIASLAGTIRKARTLADGYGATHAYAAYTDCLGKLADIETGDGLLAYAEEMLKAAGVWRAGVEA